MPTMSTEKLPKALQMLRDMGVDIKQFTFEDVKGFEDKQWRAVYNSMMYTWTKSDPTKKAEYIKFTKEEQVAAMRDYVIDTATGTLSGTNESKVKTGKSQKHVSCG